MIFQRVPELIKSGKIIKNAKIRFSEILKKIENENLLKKDFNILPEFHFNSLMLALDYYAYLHESHENWYHS